MPLYDFECPSGHAFEAWSRPEDCDASTCPECGQRAGIVWSLKQRNAQRFLPPIVHELIGWTPADPRDRYYYPGASDEPLKEGYKAHTLDSISKADRLTAEMDRHYRQQTLEQAEANNRYFDDARKERRASIDNEMRRTGMDASGRARFLRDAIRRYVDSGAERKRRAQMSGGPNTSIQVFDRDVGNRQDYSRDGRERGRKA